MMLGTIVALQIQREPMKIGKAPMREYRTDALVAARQLITSDRGVVGVTAQGEHVQDVHHADHPRSRDRKANAGITVMSVGDYEWLRATYGNHLADQQAGNSILIDSPQQLAFKDLSAGFTIRTSSGALPVSQVRVADPCVEFSRFCLKLSPSPEVGDDIKQALIDLDNGRRGFRGKVDGDGIVSIGDTVHLNSNPIPWRNDANLSG